MRPFMVLCFVLSLVLLVGVLFAATIKPPTGTALNTTGPYYATMTHAYPLWSLTGTDLISGQATAPGGTSPDSTNDATYGQGWANNATAGKTINTQLATGFVKNLTRFAAVMVVRVDTLPGAAAVHTYASDSVADADGATRFSFFLANGILGTTGVKWDASFRTGLAASTVRNVNAAAGGITVGTNTYWVLGFDYDSAVGGNTAVDAYTLYVNGTQEAQSTVAESAMPNTNPNTAPRFLGGGSTGTGPVGGAIFFFAVWNDVLGSTAHAAIAANPWILFKTGRSHRILGALPVEDMFRSALQGAE